MANHQALVSCALLAACCAAAPLDAQCGDYDGDGFDDLPAASPAQDLGATPAVGALNVIYGSGNGLTAAGDDFFTPQTPGVQGDPFAYNYFGWAVASGDFDSDGFEDLACSAAWASHAELYCGAVHVLYGTQNGLTPAGDQYWHRNSPGVKGGTSFVAQFGYALAVGDFDDDGFDDLAIGVPNDRDEHNVSAGSVHILYGSHSGLTAAGDQVFSQSTAGVRGTGSAQDGFGFSLAAGDFDGDGRDDLAIGVPFERVDGAVSAGAVAVLYGTPGGLTASGDQLWHQNSPGINNNAEAGDQFGMWLAAGDFDDDGRDDLAIGIPREGVNGQLNAGALAVLYGSSAGLSAQGDQLWSQDSNGIAESSDESDSFGWAIRVGDFDGDSHDDVAIGIPFERLGTSVTYVGAVAILYGSPSGLDSGGDQFISQGTPGVLGEPAPGDKFGAALYVGDFDGDGHDDLGVCALSEAVGAVNFAGSVTVFYGSNSGVSIQGEQVWTQDSAGIKDVAEQGDSFGGLAVRLLTN